MKQLKKNYYPLPEAEERSNQPIDDFLCLAEHRDIRLWVVAHDWPIVWSEEKPVTGNPTIEAKKPIKPPFDYYYSGYLNLCSNDILRLRVNEEVSLSTVFAEKEGQEFIGDIKRDDSSYLFRQHEFDFEIDNVFVSHEDLLRVENREVGDWQIKSESIVTT